MCPSGVPIVARSAPKHTLRHSFRPQSLWHHFEMFRLNVPATCYFTSPFCSALLTTRFTFKTNTWGSGCLLSHLFPPSVRRSTPTLPATVIFRLFKWMVVRIFALRSCVTSNKKNEINRNCHWKKKSYFYRSKIELCSNVLYLIMEPKRPRGLAMERWQRRHVFVVVNDFVTVKRGLNTVSGYNISP